MSFFLGFAEGFNQAQERKLKREIWLGEESSKRAKELRTTRKAVIEDLVKKRNETLEEVTAHAGILQNFRRRLTDVPIEEREAFIGLLETDYEYSKDLWDKLEEVESDENIRIEGSELIEFDDIVGRYTPENMTRGEFAKTVMEDAFSPQSRVAHYDDMLMRVMAAQEPEEVEDATSAALTPFQPEVNYELGGPADPDPRPFVDLDPAEIKAQREIFEATMGDLFLEEFQNYNEMASSIDPSLDPNDPNVRPEGFDPERWQQLQQYDSLYAGDNQDRQALYAALRNDPVIGPNAYIPVQEAFPNLRRQNTPMDDWLNRLYPNPNSE